MGTMKNVEAMKNVEVMKDIEIIKHIENMETPENFNTTKALNDIETKPDKVMINNENPSKNLVFTSTEILEEKEKFLKSEEGKENRILDFTKPENEFHSEIVKATDDSTEFEKIDDLILVNEIFKFTNHIEEEENTSTISPLAKEMIEQVFNMEITTSKNNIEASTEILNNKVNDVSEQDLLLEELNSTYSTDPLDIVDNGNQSNDEIFYDTDLILTTGNSQPLEVGETEFDLVSVTEKIPSIGNDFINEAIEEFTLNPLNIVTERTFEETTFGIVELVTSKAIEKLHQETTQVSLLFSIWILTFYWELI